MGVPVVTCPGETFAGRHSLSHLANVGLTETVAGDAREYVALAVRLAGDLPHLAALRAGLRERMARSPLCDGARFAGHLSQHLRDVWRQWCRSDHRSIFITHTYSAARMPRTLRYDEFRVASHHSRHTPRSAASKCVANRGPSHRGEAATRARRPWRSSESQSRCVAHSTARAT